MNNMVPHNDFRMKLSDPQLGKRVMGMSENFAPFEEEHFEGNKKPLPDFGFGENFQGFEGGDNFQFRR